MHGFSHGSNNPKQIQALKRKTTMMRNHGKKRLKVCGKQKPENVEGQSYWCEPIPPPHPNPLQDIKKSKGHKVNRVAHVEGARPAAIGEV